MDNFNFYYVVEIFPLSVWWNIIKQAVDIWYSIVSKVP